MIKSLKKPETILLLIIFIIGLLLRFKGIYPGYPLTHADEPTIVDSAIRIAFDFDFKPMGYYYGSFLSLLFAAINIFIFIPILTAYLPFFFLHESLNGSTSLLMNCIKSSEILRSCVFYPFRNFWNYSGRIETVVISSLAILLIYYLISKLFNKHIALIASFLTAINYRHVLSSVFSLADAPTASVILLSFILSSRLIKNRAVKDYVLAGIGLSLALSTKYFVYAIPPFILFHIFSYWQSTSKLNLGKRIIYLLFNSKLIFSLIISILLFVFMNIFIFTDNQNFLIQWEINSKRYGVYDISLNSFKGVSWFHIYYLINYVLTPITFVFSILGTLVSIAKKPKETITILSLLIPFFFFFTVLSKSPNVRNFAPVIPLLLVFPSVFIYYFSQYLTKRFKKSKLFHYTLIVLLTTITSFQSLKYSLITVIMFSKPQNSSDAVSWMKNNFTKNDGVLQYWGAVIPPSLKLNINNIKPIENYYYSIQEIQDENLKWAVVSSDSQSYINNQRWVKNDPLIKESFFNNYSLTNFLSNEYGNLVTQEIYYYKVKEFTKGTSFLSIDPAFFVSKIPPNIKLSNKKVVYSNPNLQNITCNQKIIDFDTDLNKVYVVNAKTSLQNNLEPAEGKNGYLRLDLTDLNKDRYTFVSKQGFFNYSELDNLIIIGVSQNQSRAVLWFNSDNCDKQEYIIYDLNIYEVDLSEYSKDFNINIKNKLPLNFYWQLPL